MFDFDEDVQSKSASESETLLQESARIRAEVRAAALRHNQAVVALAKTLEESQRLLDELRHFTEMLSPSPKVVTESLVSVMPHMAAPSAPSSCPELSTETTPQVVPPQILFVKRGTLYQC